ncbi:MAG: hypothetical protein H0T71_00585, partial [Acidobacteria bacterium]|nr:hypothetical protein [Acidobacteriota bacterium]
MAGVLAVAVAATLTADVDRDAAPAAGRERRAELRAISTKLDGARSQVLIESSEPVAYVTSQPDPLTVLVDLRNVSAGMMPPGVLGPMPPVSDVRVEEAVAGDGAIVARVRVKLAHPAKHRVRSSRNVIYVEVDRPVVAHDAAPGAGTAAPASPGSSGAQDPSGSARVAPAMVAGPVAAVAQPPSPAPVAPTPASGIFDASMVKSALQQPAPPPPVPTSMPEVPPPTGRFQ